MRYFLGYLPRDRSHLFYSLCFGFAGMVAARERESLDVLEGEEVLLQCR